MTSDECKAMLARLSGIPERIARALQAIPAAVRETEGLPSGGWSAAEVLAHLRASDDILAYRIYAMLVRDNPPLPAYDDRRWADIAGYARADLDTSLRLYTLRRAELAAMLQRATPADWARTGVHEQRGSIAVGDVVTLLVEHEEEHCQQLERLRWQR